MKFEPMQYLKNKLDKLLSGQFIHAERSDRETDVTFGLTIERVNAIMLEATQGYSANQARLSLEIEEKNHDITHAMQTRRNAISACDWVLKCTDKNANDALEKLTNELKKANIDKAIKKLSTSIIPGYAGVEIIWGSGGTIDGFEPIATHAFTFQNGYVPQLLIQNVPTEIPLGKIIFHDASRSDDTCRGGLIRPLAWLYCFANVNIKYLLSFVERFGMPFIVAKVDSASFNQEKNTLKKLIRNFGSSGGGLFSKNVELEMLQSANNGGDCYFKLLEYVEKAITKVILGQTASAGDGTGWSKDSAQSKVRQDILDADCRMLEATINEQLIQVWQRFNAPHLTSPIEFEILSVPPSDEKAIFETKKIKVEMILSAIEKGAISSNQDLANYICDYLEIPKCEVGSMPIGAPMLAMAENESIRPIGHISPMASVALAEEKEISPISGEERAPSSTNQMLKAINTLFGDTYNAIQEAVDSDDEALAHSLESAIKTAEKADTAPFENALEETILSNISQKVRGEK